jgi:FixJ family two-component response regulator
VTLIAVVDDDEPVRQGLQALLSSMGYAVRAFASGEELLGADCLARTDCLVLDINMPGMSGPELEDELARRRNHIPIVFITAYGDDPRSRSSLLKPFTEEALSAALADALAGGRAGGRLGGQADRGADTS